MFSFPNALPVAFYGAGERHYLKAFIAGEGAVFCPYVELVPVGPFVALSGVHYAEPLLVGPWTAENLPGAKIDPLAPTYQRDVAVYLLRVAAMVSALRLSRAPIVYAASPGDPEREAFFSLRTDAVNGNCCALLIRPGEKRYFPMNRTIEVRVWESPAVKDPVREEASDALVYTLAARYLGPALAYELDAPEHEAMEDLMDLNLRGES
jgi:hypothetical protein